MCVCVLGSVLDQNVPSGFASSLSLTLESFLSCHQCALMCIKMFIYIIDLGNTAGGIHMCVTGVLQV